MTDAVKSRRPYRSRIRADQAQLTRDRIVAAARELFLSRGFGSTTVAAVAADADVAPETVYATFGGKRGLMEAIITAAIRNQDDIAEDARWAGQIQTLATPQERLRAWVAHTCERLKATSPVHAMIRGAADSEPFAAALRERLLAERLSLHTTRCHQFLAGQLRAGLTVEQAAQRYSALLSPDLHHLLTRDMGWPAAQHQSWVTALLEADLLTDPGCGE
jgi:AcrR family transcriptional regulator